MCNLHLQSFIRGHERLVDVGIREVVVFHASAIALKDWQANAPFDLVADPMRALYLEFGVEPSWLAVLHPRAIWAMLRGLVRHGMRLPSRGESVLGLPADFMFDNEGVLRAVHYARHGDDQWKLAEVIAKKTELSSALRLA